MASELNRKLIIILSSLFMPLLAALCAQSNTRGRNVFQGIFSIAFMILFQQLIQFGGLVTDRLGISPFITMWPVFGLLAFGTILFLVLQDLRAGRPSERIASTLIDAAYGLKAWLSPATRRKPQRQVIRRRIVRRR